MVRDVLVAQIVLCAQPASNSVLLLIRCQLHLVSHFEVPVGVEDLLSTVFRHLQLVAAYVGTSSCRLDFVSCQKLKLLIELMVKSL